MSRTEAWRRSTTRSRMMAVLEGAGGKRMTVVARRSGAGCASGLAARRLPAVGRIRRLYCMDAPSRASASGGARLIGEMEKKTACAARRVHAGDGNLHRADSCSMRTTPTSCAARSCSPPRCSREQKCVAVGAPSHGEHGVGRREINQMCVQFGADERGVPRAEARVRSRRPAQPGKAVPTWRAARSTGACGARRASCRIPSARF